MTNILFCCIVLSIVERNACKDADGPSDDTMVQMVAAAAAAAAAGASTCE